MNTSDLVTVQSNDRQITYYRYTQQANITYYLAMFLFKTF